MLRTSLFAVFLCLCVSLPAQMIAYVGNIYGTRAEIMIERVSGSAFRGTLVFSQTDVPLQLESGLVLDYQYRSPLRLWALRGADTLGYVHFPRFDPTVVSTSGYFQPKDPKAKARPMGLNRNFVLNFCEREPETGFKRYEWQQGIEVDSFYFRIEAQRPVGEICVEAVGLKVYKKKKDELLQSFSGFSYAINHCTTLEKGDYNFDGFNDIRLLRQIENGQLVYCDYFLFNPRKGEFAPEKKLNGLASAEFDANKRQIQSYKLDEAGQLVVDQAYIWEEGKALRLLK
jgi:hypothetical protein